MIRAVLALCAVLIAAFGALAGAGMFDSFLRSDEIARDRLRGIAAAGIRERLDERYSKELRFFIIGRDIDDKRWDFRGQVVQGAEAKPLYGVARRDCEPLAAGAAECWEFEKLAVNGEELVAVDTESARVSGVAAAVTLGEQGGGIDTATAPAPGGADLRAAAQTEARGDGQPETLTRSAAQPPAAPPSAAKPAPPPSQPSAEPPAPTHVVSGTEVNMRAGPGLNFETLGVSYQGQELLLLEDKGEWARFRLIGGEKDGEEVWLFTPLTRPKA